MEIRELVYWRYILLFGGVTCFTLYQYSLHSSPPISKQIQVSATDSFLLFHTNSTVAEGEIIQPSANYEDMRRRLKRNILEQGFYISSELDKLLENNATRNLSSDITNVLNMVNEQKRALISQLEALHRDDGYAEWRQWEAMELSDLVQRRLHYLQNPKNCTSVRKLICQLDRGGCGFGCMLHRTVNCLMVAYRTQRTLIFRSNVWRYHKGGWEAVYLPLSSACGDENWKATRWPGKNDTEALDFISSSMVYPTPSAYIPFSIPEDLAPRLKRLHGLPFVWWVGQMLKYILKPQENTTKLLEETKIRIGFQRPIVGVHIRRTDKKSEAKYYPVQEYMDAVEEYYNVLELTQKVPVRRIYLATDEPKVFSEVKQKYPQYEILGDSNIVKTTSHRYSESSLMGLITDLHFISLSDYLVCTLSSNFGRLAYELMQTYHPDATDKVRSLDWTYVFHLVKEPHRHIVVYPHESRNNGEIQLQVGDIIVVHTNYWNGYSRGRNERTKKTGSFPSFKVVRKVETVEFPTYSEISKP